MSITHALSAFFRAFWQRLPRKYLWVLPADAVVIVMVPFLIHGADKLARLPADVEQRGRYAIVKGDTVSGSHLRVGDTILTFDEHEIVFAGLDENVLRRVVFTHTVGDTVPIIAGRKEGRVELREVLTARLDPESIWADVTLGVVWFALGVLVFLVSPNDFGSVLFNLMGIGLLLQTVTFAHWRFDVPPIVHGAALLYIILNSAVVLHFLLIFPKTRSWRWAILAPFYAIFALTCLGTEITATQIRMLHSPDWVEALLRISRYAYPAMNFAGAAILLYSYFSSREPATRKRLRWTLFGGTVALLWAAATINIPRLLDIPFTLGPWTSTAGMLAAPIGITIGLIWYNAFDTDLALSRTMAYVILLSMIALGYEGLMYVITSILGNTVSAQSSIVSSIVATSIIAISFEPIKDWVQKFVDVRFFQEFEPLDVLEHAKHQSQRPLNTLEAIGKLTAMAGGELRSEQNGEFIEVVIHLPNDRPPTAPRPHP